MQLKTVLFSALQGNVSVRPYFSYDKWYLSERPQPRKSICSLDIRVRHRWSVSQSIVVIGGGYYKNFLPRFFKLLTLFNTHFIGPFGLSEIFAPNHLWSCPPFALC